MKLVALTKNIQQWRWGSWCLVSFYLSVASGILIALQYDPAAPFYSVTSLDLLVPYGEYFRALHFYSSQFFFLFCLAHFVAAYHKSDNYPSVTWVMLVCTLPIALLLLFTGYILRADSTGYSAGMIAEAIVKTIPGAGRELNALLFDISDHGLQRVYVHHVISFDLLFLMLAWDHLRRYRVKLSEHIPLLCLTLILSLFLPAPIEPGKPGMTYILGPWFFLGLQELLRYLPPLIAGVVFPSLLLAAVLHFRKRNPYYRTTLWFIILWLLMYSILTAIAWLR